MKTQFCLVVLATALKLTAQEIENPVIVTKALNPQEVIIVPTAYNITTTLEFPEPIQGIDGVGLTDQPQNSKENAVLFAVSHAAGHPPTMRSMAESRCHWIQP